EEGPIEPREERRRAVGALDRLVVAFEAVEGGCLAVPGVGPPWVELEGAGLAVHGFLVVAEGGEGVALQVPGEVEGGLEIGRVIEALQRLEMPLELVEGQALLEPGPREMRVPPEGAAGRRRSFVESFERVQGARAARPEERVPGLDLHRL